MAKHLLRYEEWNILDNWYCNDSYSQDSIASLWWAPARMLNLSLEDYIKLLIDKFKVDNIKYFKDNNVLVYSWKSQAAMRVFKNWVNAEARKRNFIC